MVCCALRQSLIAATSPTVVGRDASGGNNAFVSATKVNLNPTSYLFILLPRTPPLFPTQRRVAKNAWARFFVFSSSASIPSIPSILIYDRGLGEKWGKITMHGSRWRLGLIAIFWDCGPRAVS